MDKKFYYFVLLTIATCTTTKAVPVLPILSKVTDVVSFGIDVYSFIDELLSGREKPATIDYDRIINTINERIDMSTEKIISEIELQSLLSDLRDIALSIKQLLAEMESVIKENDETARDERKQRFHDSFVRQKSAIYNIKNLLSFDFGVSGLSNTLLAHVAKALDCGMTQLDEFQNYYMTLVSDVVALSLFYERLSGENNLYNQTLTSWKETIVSHFSDFDIQNQDCKDKLVQLAKKDFDSIDNAKELFENNQYRYPYTINSVYSLTGKYCVRYLKYYNKIFKKGNDNSMTFAVFIDYEKKPLLGTHEYRATATNTKLGNCKTDTGAIIYSFNRLGYDLLFSLMFLTSEKGKFQIFQDEDAASAIHTEVDGSEYTTIFVVESKNDSPNSPTLKSEDYNVHFVKESEPEGKGLPTWGLALAITLPIVTVIIIIWVYWKCRKKNCDCGESCCESEED